MWGCEAEQATVPAEMDGDNGEVIEYGHCPLRFVGRSVDDFINRFEYLERFPHTAKPYDELSDRWKAFEAYYRGKTAVYEESIRRRRNRGQGA